MRFLLSYINDMGCPERTPQQPETVPKLEAPSEDLALNSKEEQRQRQQSQPELISILCLRRFYIHVFVIISVGKRPLYFNY